VQEEIEKFEKLLIRPDDFENRSRLAFLWSKGDQFSGRGMGKTALLQYFRQRINADWGYTEFNGAFSAAVLYTAFPNQVDRRYMEQLAWSALVDLCQGHLLKASRAALRAKAIGQAQAAQSIVTAPDGSEDAGRLLDDDILRQNGLTPAQIDEQITQELCAADIAPPVAAALARGCFQEFLESLRRDGSLEPYYMPRDTKGLDLSRSLLFNEIVRYLREAGFAGGYLFVDDIENLVDQMTRKHRLEFAKEFGLCMVRPGYANTQYQFFSCVVTTHQSSANPLAQAWTEAGLQQFARLDPTAPTSVELPLPTEDQAKQIVVAHLDYYRTDQNEMGSIEPFTPDAMEALCTRNKQPRILLSSAHQIFSQAADKGLEKIDLAAVESAMDSTASVSAADYTVGIDEAL
jgi:hypothetical protein